MGDAAGSGTRLAPALAQDVLVLAGANANPTALIKDMFEGRRLHSDPDPTALRCSCAAGPKVSKFDSS
jgi:hypothetical protein